jgi:hypothetical protein
MFQVGKCVTYCLSSPIRCFNLVHDVSCSLTSVAPCTYGIVRSFGFGTHRCSMLELCDNLVTSAVFCHSTSWNTQATALGPCIAEEVQDQARKEGLIKSMSPSASGDSTAWILALCYPLVTWVWGESRDSHPFILAPTDGTLQPVAIVFEPLKGTDPLCEAWRPYGATI